MIAFLAFARTALTFVVRYWRVVAVVGTLLFTFAAGYHTRAVKCAAERQEEINQALNNALDANQRQQKVTNALAKKTEAQLAAQRAQVNQLTRRLQDEIAKNAVYRDCHVTPDGVQSLNATVAAGGAAR